MAQQQPQPASNPTDPAAWLASKTQQPTPGPEPSALTDPAQWLAQKSSDAASAVGGAVKGATTYAIHGDPIGDLKSWAKDIYEGGKSALSTALDTAKKGLQDPHTTLPTIGAIAGPLAVPEAPIAAASLGSAGGEALADAYDAYKGRPVNDMTTGMGIQAAVGAVPGVLGKVSRPVTTEMGGAVKALYGDSALPSQMTKSTYLDFLKNISEGMTGAPTMERASAAQRDITQSALTRSAAGMQQGAAPVMGADTIGGNVQQGLSDALDKAQDPFTKKGGYYDKFFKAVGTLKEKVVNEYGEETAGPSVRDLHDARSEALAQGRKAEAANNDKGVFDARQTAENLRGRINKLIGPEGERVYSTISDRYKQVMDTYDNPIVAKLREGVKPEQVADVLLNPEQKFPTWNEKGQKVALGVSEMIGKIRAALPPEQFDQLRTATVQRMMENAYAPVKTDSPIMQISGAALQNQAQTMGRGFNALFGEQSIPLRNLINTISYAQKTPTTGAGEFFINLRQAAAVSTVVGTAAHFAGGQDTRSSTEEGLAAGAAYLFAPWALAKIMTTPSLHPLLIKAQEAATPSMQRVVVNQITKALAQFAPRAAAAPEIPAPTFQGKPATIPPPPR